MPKIKDVTEFLESIAPLDYQESYDNSGLLTGNPGQEVSGILITLDCTEAVVKEAAEKECNLIVAHHPIIFRGLKKLTGRNYVERTVIEAVKQNIAIYAIHTNLDNVINGVNHQIASMLGLQDTKILRPRNTTLSKLVTFLPPADTNSLIEGLGAAGAGIIGNYSKCSFRVNGTGTFEGNEDSNPAVGERGQFEEVNEDRLEIIFPTHLSNRILDKMRELHPYEEPAYYLTHTANVDPNTGSGMTGQLKEAMEPHEFLRHLKDSLGLKLIRHTPLLEKPIKRVALCGGSGSFLLPAAITSGADAYISADFKYHEFFDADNQILVTDIGHYESEVYTKDLIYDLLNNEFNNFALNLSKENTNPVNYFY